VIVVDTNVIAYLFLETGRQDAAERLLRRDPEWAVPVLWRSEMRNVLATEMAQRGLGLQLALGIQQEAEDLLAEREFEVPSDRVLPLAERSRCSAYDCEFVALADSLDVPLYTADAGLLKAFPKRARPLG
jgi:predicted nucleic acid-binding protein